MEIKQIFGFELKKQRLEKKLSQQELAKGICSQPLLSAIERGKYSPNSEILIALCQRLDLDSDFLVLATSYQISQSQEFNRTCEALCNDHRYAELLAFLNQPAVLEQIDEQDQLSGYYYYLGCCQFHFDLTKAQDSLQLALAEAPHNQTLQRLILASLGLISARKQATKQSKLYFKQAVQGLTDLPFEKNQTIIFYLQALAYLELKQFSDALNSTKIGINFATTHDSHYLLANLFYLAGRVTDSTTDLAKSQLLADLFAEKIYKLS